MASRLLATRSAIIVVLVCGIAAAFALIAPRRQAAAQSRGPTGSFFGFFSSGDERFAPSGANRAPVYAPPTYAPPTYAPSRLPARPRAVRRLRPSRHSSPESDGDSWSGRTTWCVRLCDGRYFPLSRPAASSRANAVQMCSALCPAAKVDVFRGDEIAEAKTTGGTRYWELDDAFLYRKRVVADCTCNGRDAFGLATIDVTADPTLRRGDVVATEEGLTVFRGAHGDAHTADDFRPIASEAFASASPRRKFARRRLSHRE